MGRVPRRGVGNSLSPGRGRTPVPRSGLEPVRNVAGCSPSKLRMQLLKQRSSLLEIRCVEALCEPAVYLSEEVAGLGTTAFLGPEAGQANRGAEFERARPCAP